MNKNIYEFKFYLGAVHYLVFNKNTRSEIHPHTWELSFKIKMDFTNDAMKKFTDIEKTIETFLTKF